ncbi:MAG: hypothetical protein ACHQ1G_08110 [Planctomycetota bacterium]
MKERIADLAVGLAADCDAPESVVESMMRTNLKGANALPFAAFVTHDGKWVGGFSGFKDAAEFAKVLAAAEESPLIRATDAVMKKLAALVDRAGKAAEKGDWKTVVAAGRDGAKTTGRCPERKALAAILKQAREWAKGRLDGAASAAQAGDMAAANEAIAEVRKQFAGEPEAADADLGTKAVRRLALIPAGDAGARNREKAAQEFQDTRWAAIFTPKPAAAAEPAPKPEAPSEGDDEGLQEGCG